MQFQLSSNVTGGSAQPRRGSDPVRPEDATSALARVEMANQELEYMIDDSLAAKEHGTLALFSNILRSRAGEVRKKMKAIGYVGAGKIEDPPPPSPPSHRSCSPRPAGQPPLVSAPAAVVELKGLAAPPPQRPIVNIGRLCGELRKQQQRGAESPTRDRLLAGPAHSPSAGSRVLLPPLGGSSPPPASPASSLLPHRITNRKLRPVRTAVALREQPPEQVVKGRVNYDALLREQRELNKRRLEGERVYKQLMDRFDAYQTRLLQLLPNQKLFASG